MSDVLPAMERLRQGILAKRNLWVLYLWAIAALGAWALAYNSPPLTSRAVAITVLMAVLVWAAEMFPIRVPWGNASMALPIMYGAYLVGGPSCAVWSSSLGIISAGLIRRRPVRAVVFNGSQYALAAWAGAALASLVQPTGPWGGLGQMVLLMLGLTVVNNACFDGWMWLRAPHYSLKDWMAKNREEGYTLVPAIVYGAFMYLTFDAQQPTADRLLLSYLPLIACSLLWYLFSQLRKARTRLQTLAAVTTGTSGILSLEESCEVVLGHMADVLKCVRAVVYKLESSGTGDPRLVPVATWGALTGVAASIDANVGIAGRVVKTGKPEIVANVEREPAHAAISPMDAPVRAMLAVPVLLEKQVVGVIVAGHNLPGAFYQEDLELVTALSTQVAVAIRNTDVVRQREQMAVMEERQRLARDIHDGLAQALGGLVLDADHCERLWERDPAAGRQKLTRIREALRDNLTEVRRSIYNLRPHHVEALGLLPVLEQCLRKFGREHGLEVDWRVDGAVRKLEAETEDAIFQIVQEALANVHNHAGATRLTLMVAFQPTAVKVAIVDNGQGFDLLQAAVKARQNQRYGLIGMNERTRALGGTLTIESSPGEGARVEVEFPIGA